MMQRERSDVISFHPICKEGTLFQGELKAGMSFEAAVLL